MSALYVEFFYKHILFVIWIQYQESQIHSDRNINKLLQQLTVVVTLSTPWVKHFEKPRKCMLKLSIILLNLRSGLVTHL